MLNQIIFYCASVLRTATLQLLCVATIRSERIYFANVSITTVIIFSADDNSCYRNVCKMSVVSFALNGFMFLKSKSQPNSFISLHNWAFWYPLLGWKLNSLSVLLTKYRIMHETLLSFVNNRRINWVAGILALKLQVLLNALKLNTREHAARIRIFYI